MLKKAGRQCGIAEEADRLHELLRQHTMRQPATVERVMGLQQGLLRQLGAICATVAELETSIETAYQAHPDSRIVSSLPGSERNSAPGSSPRSATIAIDSPMPEG
ncbi:hypothetical protein [Nocardia vinacea]|uniref:hypothetical protein n=1 Tax=Nocardia vinacea TaxID=96468 RepID=UPI0012F6FC66|nr:hypothetical protein [Nocardia vinacea]